MSAGEPTSLQAVAAALLRDVDRLAVDLADTVMAQIDIYGRETFASRDQMVHSFRDNLRDALVQLSGQRAELDLAIAERTGTVRAMQGMPLPELLRVYRLGQAFLFERLIAGARASGATATDALLDSATAILALTDEYSLAVTNAHRRVTMERALADDRRRSGLLSAILEGGTPNANVWELARLLDFPYEGSFVVVVAEAVERGTYPLPGIAVTLESLRIGSAWRSRPDFEVGLLSLDSADDAGPMLAAVGTLATSRVGCSPAFGRLDGAARALRLARVAMDALPEGVPAVRQLVDEPHIDFLVKDIDDTRRFVDRVLGPILRLADEDRAVLLDTVQVWVRVRGSVSAAARDLYCHENTVRHRLRRLENKIGMQLSDPSAIAEVATALAAIRIFPDLGRPLSEDGQAV